MNDNSVDFKPDKRTLHLWKINDDPHYRKYLVMKTMERLTNGIYRCECCNKDHDAAISLMYEWKPFSGLLPGQKNIFCDECTTHFHYPGCNPI